MFEGQFAWRELSTPDPKAAQAFYTALFGWTFDEMPMPEIGSYTVFKRGERQIAGMMKTMDELPPTWVGYAFVDSVDAASERGKAAGGQVLAPPMDIPDIGRCSWLLDPAGALICPFTASMPPPDFDPEDFEPQEHEFGWAALETHNLAAAEAFYGRTMGWKFQRKAPPGEPAFLEIQGTPRARGSIDDTCKPGSPAFWRHYVQVASIEKTLAKAVSLGGTTRLPPTPIGKDGIVGVLADPQGAEFGLWSK